MNLRFDYFTIKLPSQKFEKVSVYKLVNTCNKFKVRIYFCSASCRETYGVEEQKSAELGAETRALCTSEYSDISPLSGGNVPFSTLEGRPSAYTFDSSPELQV